ncbi:hypothetical protein, partial [Rhodanobacter lindaniclasticus]
MAFRKDKATVAATASAILAVCGKTVCRRGNLRRLPGTVWTGFCSSFQRGAFQQPKGWSSWNPVSSGVAEALDPG